MKRPLTPGERKLGAKTRKILEERFPLAFVGKGVPKRPLQIGIYVDIHRAWPELSHRAIQLALADYTHGPRYARCLVEGAERIGIYGTPDGTVTAGHAAWAAKILAGFERVNAEPNTPDPGAQQQFDSLSEEE